MIRIILSLIVCFSFMLSAFAYDDWSKYLDVYDSAQEGFKKPITQKEYQDAYECHSPKAKELWGLLQYECDKYGIIYKMDDIIQEYKRRYGTPQLSLFD